MEVIFFNDILTVLCVWRQKFEVTLMTFSEHGWQQKKNIHMVTLKSEDLAFWEWKTKDNATFPVQIN